MRQIQGAGTGVLAEAFDVFGPVSQLHALKLRKGGPGQLFGRWESVKEAAAYVPAV